MIQETLRNYFLPAKIEDHQRHSSIIIISITLWVLMLSSFMVAVVTIWINPSFTSGQISTIVAFVVFAGLLVLTYRGYVNLVTISFVTFMFFLATYMLIESGSVRNVDVTLYFLVIVTAGLLLGPRAVAISGIATIIALLGIFLGEVYNLLPPPTQEYRSSTVASISILIASFAPSTFLLYRTVTHLDREATSAKRSAKSLQDQAIMLIGLNRELRNSEATIRTILSEIPDIIFRTNRDGHWIDVHNVEQLFDNKLFATSKKANQIETVAEKFSEIHPLIQTAIQTSEIQRLDFKVMVDQLEHDLEARVIPNSSGEIIGIIRDVTKDKQIEETIRQAQKLDSVGLLAGGVAHDFNNWLTGVITQLTLAQSKINRLTSLNGDSREPEELMKKLGTIESHLNKAKAASVQAADLTQQLLTYAGHGKPDTESIEMNRFIVNNLDLVKVALKKNIEIEIDLHTDQILVSCEPSKIQQVIMNLVINASEAVSHRRGKVQIRTAVEFFQTETSHPNFVAGRKLRPGNYAKVSVSDNGSGMDYETVSKIFDPFFTTKKSGKGLGLSSSLGIIIAHQGTIEIDTALNKGTTFTIYLPIQLDLEQKGAGPQQEGYLIPDGLTLLVVDDEKPVRDAVVDVCDDWNLSVLQANNGVSGLSVYRENQADVDIILMDVRMPTMNGVDAWHEIKAINPDAKIIISSGFNTELTDPDMIDAPFLPKPWTTEQFKQVIYEVIQDPSSEEALSVVRSA